MDTLRESCRVGYVKTTNHKNMIEGLKVTIVGAEVKELCEKRAQHHAARAAVYRDQKASMEANEIGEMNYSNGDPKRAVKDKQDQHEGDAAEMAFIAAHLIPTEQYLLDAAALAKLGISRRGY